MAILIVAVVGQTVSPILSIYADKCDQDSQRDSKNTSNTQAEDCKVEANMNVQNSNVQSSSSIECSENGSQSKPTFAW
jgi:hypothetical protein